MILILNDKRILSGLAITNEPIFKGSCFLACAASEGPADSVCIASICGLLCVFAVYFVNQRNLCGQHISDQPAHLSRLI